MLFLGDVDGLGLFSTSEGQNIDGNTTTGLDAVGEEGQ